MTDHSELLNDIKGAAQEDATIDVRKSFGLMAAQTLDARSLKRVVDLVNNMEKLKAEGGTAKWFTKDSPWPIEMLPKHKAFFDAGATYDERLCMAANR